MSRFKINIPLRIDLCGGFSDIDEIGNRIGTSIVNVACNVKRVNNEPFSIMVNDDSTIGNIAFIEYEKKYYNTNYYTKKLVIEKSEFDSLGMGSSSAVSVAIVMYLAKCHKEFLEDDEIFKRAKYLEAGLMNIKGGIQDFIGVINGGYNWITRNKRVVVDDFKLCVNDKERLDDFFAKNVLFISCKSVYNSSEIVKDIISDLDNSEKMDALKIIKDCNNKIAALLTSCTEFDSKLKQMMHLINISWEAQKKLGEYVVNETMKAIEIGERDDCLAVHGTGAGGRGILLYLKKSVSIEYINELMKKYRDIAVYNIQIASNSIADDWKQEKLKVV